MTRGIGSHVCNSPIYHASPLGGGEWAFFNSYGINANSIVRKRASGSVHDSAAIAQPEDR